VRRRPGRLCASVSASLFLLAGCASQLDPETPISSDLPLERVIPNEASPDTSPAYPSLIAIDSDNVSMAGYDAKNQVMTVLFDNGGVYEYYEVPREIWERFLDAQPDPWSKVGYPELVKGGYAYQKITP